MAQALDDMEVPAYLIHLIMTGSEVHPNYGLSKSKDENFADDNFISPLPRAVKLSKNSSL
jgi:hypothetical protein